MYRGWPRVSRRRSRRPEETAMRKVIALALGLLAAGTLAAQAQSYPTRIVTIVVPYPAGGPTDTIPRNLAERLQGALGQSVLIENIRRHGPHLRLCPRAPPPAPRSQPGSV